MLKVIDKEITMNIIVKFNINNPNSQQKLLELNHKSNKTSLTKLKYMFKGEYIESKRDNNLIINSINTTQDINNSFLETIDSQTHKLARETNVATLQQKLNTSLEEMNITLENMNAVKSSIHDIKDATETISITSKQIIKEAQKCLSAQAKQNPIFAKALLL